MINAAQRRQETPGWREDACLDSEVQVSMTVHVLQPSDKGQAPQSEYSRVLMHV